MDIAIPLTSDFLHNIHLHLPGVFSAEGKLFAPLQVALRNNLVLDG